MIEPGKLRNFITVQKLDGSLDAAGQENKIWVTHGQRWASIEPLSARELFSARQFHAEVSHRVRMRYLAGVVPKMRINAGGRVLEILTVFSPENLNAELELLCFERV